jgi:hypothetical protein
MAGTKALKKKTAKTQRAPREYRTWSITRISANLSAFLLAPTSLVGGALLAPNDLGSGAVNLPSDSK